MTEVNEISGVEASELLDLAIANKLESTESTEEVVEDNTDATDDDGEEVEETEENESSEDIEDTENEAESDEEGDTEEQIDGEAQEDTEESEEEAGDSTSQDVEENESEEEKDADGVDKDIEESSDEPDEDQTENNDVDVEEYNRLKDFYDKLTKTEFKVNGRKKTGFTEVDDLIKAQQAYGGLEKKFQAVKDIQPFMKSMVDNGFISDPAKYELAVRVSNGDVEAIKQVMKDKGIDPLTLDLDEGIDYAPTGDVLTKSEELAYGEAREVADNLGVTKRLEEVMFSEFDDASRVELFKDDESIKANTIALAEQIENGLYDQVMNEVDTMAIRDSKFAHLTKLDQYNRAAEVVNARNAEVWKQQREAANAEAETKKSAQAQKKAEAARVKAEKAKIEKARKEKEYKAKAAEQEKKIAADRSKASKASKPKPGATKQTKASSPLDLPSDEFASFWDGLLSLNDR